MLDQKTNVAPKPKAPAQVMDELMQKNLERKTEIPQIADILEKAKLATAQAKKLKKTQLKTWHCTQCSSSGVQLYCDGGNHFSVAMDEEGTPVNPKTSTPLSGRELANFNCVRKGKHTCGHAH